jgi:hypothetical protein
VLPSASERSIFVRSKLFSPKRGSPVTASNKHLQLVRNPPLIDNLDRLVVTNLIDWYGDDRLLTCHLDAFNRLTAKILILAIAILCSLEPAITVLSQTADPTIWWGGGRVTGLHCLPASELPLYTDLLAFGR